MAVSPRRLGAVTALFAVGVDQASKLWLLRVFGLAEVQRVRLAPFLDLYLAWNRGISYSLFTAQTDTGRYLLIGATLVATLLLGGWLRSARSRLTGVALGLIIGGALGNVVDRFAYGAVMDFVYFHLGRFSWYIFNVADCAIVVGVVLLLWEWMVARPAGDARPHAAKLP